MTRFRPGSRQSRSRLACRQPESRLVPPPIGIERRRRDRPRATAAVNSSWSAGLERFGQRQVSAATAQGRFREMTVAGVRCLAMRYSGRAAARVPLLQAAAPAVGSIFAGLSARRD